MCSLSAARCVTYGKVGEHHIMLAQLLTNCARTPELHEQFHCVEMCMVWHVGSLPISHNSSAQTLLAWLRCCNCYCASFWLVDALITVDGAAKMWVHNDGACLSNDKSWDAGSGSCCSLQSCAARPAMADKTHKVLLHAISMHIHGNTQVV